MAKLYSPSIERMAIKAACSKNLAIAGALSSVLDATYFHSAAAQEAYEAINDYKSKHGNPPSFRILCEDVGVSEETRQLLKETRTNISSLDEAHQIADKLTKFRKVRLTYQMCKALLLDLEAPKVNTDKLEAMISSNLTSIQTNRSVEDCMFHTGVDGNALDLVDEILYGEEDDQFIPTGFDSWDRVNGGLPRGGYVTLGGNSGSGKSHMAIQLGKNMANLGYKVSILPLEMTASEAYARFLANLAEVDSLRINRRKLTEEEKDHVRKRFIRFNRVAAKKGGRLSVYQPKSDVTMEQALATLHALNPDVIIIDYLGLLAGADGEDQWRKLGQMARYAKVYAGNTNKLVIGCAQVDDNGKLRYSQTVKEHSSVAWSFVATKESKEKGVINIDTFKSRNQVALNFTLKIEYQYSRVSDLSPAEAAGVEESNSPSGKTAAPRKKKGEASTMPDLDD